MSYGITGDEYAQLVLYTKSNDMLATVKEYQEYKKNGFETARDYGLAKEVGIANLNDFKKYQENEINQRSERKKAVQDAQELAKKTARDAEELANRDADAQKRGFADWKAEMRDFCADYFVYRYACDFANPLYQKAGGACISEQYKKLHSNWGEIVRKKEKACEFISVRDIDLDPVTIGLPSTYGQKSYFDVYNRDGKKIMAI
jgi:hypothetical protein